MDIIAHRGFSMRYPENTLVAFQQAALLPIDGVEFDVHLTKDGEVVVIHDELLHRTTNGQGFVKDFTLAELQQFDAGSWKDAQFAFAAIPTLAQVLEVFQHTTHTLHIELKTDIIEYPLEARVLNIIAQFAMEERVVISSFNHASLLTIRALHPTIATAALFSSLILNMDDYLAPLQCQAVHIPFYYAPRTLIQQLSASYTIRLYTLNDIRMLPFAALPHVDAIMTDDPTLLLAQLRK